jgi:hypothetical protein
MAPDLRGRSISGGYSLGIQRSVVRLRRPTGTFQLVDADLPAEGVAVDAERTGGPGLIPVKPIEDSLDKFLFELVDCLIEQNSAFNHLPN